MRDARIDEIKVRQRADRRALERAVPRVVPCEVRAEREVRERALVLVEHRAHLAHVREPVVVLRAERELAQASEVGDADGVEVPPDEAQGGEVRVRGEHGLNHVLPQFGVADPFEFT